MHLRVDQSLVFKANNLFHMYFEDALWYWSKKLKQIFIRLWWWLWMMARRRQAGVIKVSHWEHLPLKVQSSSGQVIPPTNSKLAHHPETAWPIHFLSKVSWLSKNKTNGRYIPFYFVSGPIFAVNLFATFSLSEEHPPPCLFSNIELCIIKHRGMFFFAKFIFQER